MHRGMGSTVWLASLVTQVALPFHCDARNLPTYRLNWSVCVGGGDGGLPIKQHLGLSNKVQSESIDQCKGAVFLASRHLRQQNPPKELPVLTCFHKECNTAVSNTCSARGLRHQSRLFIPGQPHWSYGGDGCLINPLTILTSPHLSVHLAREGRICIAARQEVSVHKNLYSFYPIPENISLAGERADYSRTKAWPREAELTERGSYTS